MADASAPEGDAFMPGGGEAVVDPRKLPDY